MPDSLQGGVLTGFRRVLFLSLFVLGLPALATTMVFFYDEGCPHCARVEEFLEGILPNYPELEVVYHSVREEEALELLEKLLSAYGIEGLSWSTPVIFIGEVADVGGTFYRPGQDPQPLTGRAEEFALEDAIREAIAQNAPSPLAKVKGASAGLAEKLTIPAVVLAAAADSVNPCTFAVLVLLLGTLLVAGKRGKVLQAGLAFVAAIYISYFLMGIGIFTAIQAAGVQRPFILAVSILAILLGLWNMKDYFAYGKWFTIEVPQRWRPLVKRVTSSVVSVPGAFVVGVLDSLFLLPCSSGPYIAILALLSKTTTRTTGILYLLFYNFIFVIPLLLITLGVHLGFTTTARAERWRSQRLGKLHLVSGAVMFLLGAGMIVALQLGYI
ncbi:TPA: hypothetical protein DCL37_03660 [Candidatus Acetothermia bacterium]|nr:hypothetical protein [Candidatus Acetothermia bacterium]